MMALPAKAELPVDEDGNYNFAGLGESFSNPDLLSNISSTFGSAGAAVDLGVTVDFLENFTASVSVTDLGKTILFRPNVSPLSSANLNR